MTYDKSVLIQLDRETKQKMEKIKINWSNAIREMIVQKINKQKNIAKAVALTDKIFRGQNKHKNESTSIIREMRDTRYGPNSS